MVGMENPITMPTTASRMTVPTLMMSNRKPEILFCYRFARHQVRSSLGKPMQIDLLSKF